MGRCGADVGSDGQVLERVGRGGRSGYGWCVGVYRLTGGWVGGSGAKQLDHHATPSLLPPDRALAFTGVHWRSLAFTGVTDLHHDLHHDDLHHNAATAIAIVCACACARACARAHACACPRACPRVRVSASPAEETERMRQISRDLRALEEQEQAADEMMQESNAKAKAKPKAKPRARR